MAPKGHELVLGMKKNDYFGPLLMFGSGGIYIDIFKDIAFRLAPLNRNNAKAMIQATKGYKILQGFRGLPTYDIAAIEDMLVKLSTLVIDHPNIVELDINPLIVHVQGQGTTVADCRFILASS